MIIIEMISARLSKKQIWKKRITAILSKGNSETGDSFTLKEDTEQTMMVLKKITKKIYLDFYK